MPTGWVDNPVTHTMLVSKKYHRNLRLQNYLFIILLVGIVASLAFLSTRYVIQADWTASGRNSLSDASINLLASLPDEISITSYATEDDTLRRSISGLLSRYKRQKKNLSFSFINPELAPDQVRQLGIRVNGELIVEYQGRTENLTEISESGITNTLQRLARSGERWLLFLSGHGERKANGAANHDLRSWIQQLTAKGFKTKDHNLNQQPAIPDNISLLVVASPQVDLFPGEKELIRNYLDQGGNLLWLTDPEARHGTDLLKSALGIDLQAGIVVDPSAQLLGISDPRFAIVANYPEHAVNKGFDTISLFPLAVGLQHESVNNWQGTAILRTEDRSWSETGDFSGGSIGFDQDTDIIGPVNIGYALQRPSPAAEQDSKTMQRVVVIGDGDFLSNTYLGNGGNLQLGLNIVNWLSHDDIFIEIPVQLTRDRTLQLGSVAQGVIGFGYLVLLPLLMAGTGLVIWLRRRKR